MVRTVPSSLSPRSLVLLADAPRRSLAGPPLPRPAPLVGQQARARRAQARARRPRRPKEQGGAPIRPGAAAEQDQGARGVRRGRVETESELALEACTAARRRSASLIYSFSLSILVAFVLSCSVTTLSSRSRASTTPWKYSSLLNSRRARAARCRRRTRRRSARLVKLRTSARERERGRTSPPCAP